MGPRFRMGRRRGLLVGAAAGAGIAHHAANKSQAQAAAAEPSQAAPSESTDDQFAQLEKLGQLHDQGILTDEEFNAKKQQILGL